MTESSHKQRTENSSTQKRCVNLDWLEVHVREPIGQPHTANYYRDCGYEVREREYGTPIYREMFTIYGSDGLPMIEVRRNPKSQGLHGIHDPEESHLRLVNRMCYYDGVSNYFHTFLIQHNYERIRISRVDICLDFVLFDFGDDPQKFVMRYITRKYCKINQTELVTRQKDAWDYRLCSYLHWGSNKSCITTKMYNKTNELKDKKNGSFSKPYIRQAWLLSGFIDDMQNVKKDGKEVVVWRVEFSIQSSKVGWVPICLDGDDRKKQSLHNNLEVYGTREQLLVMFASLAQHYFHFKKYKKGQRKDRCQDKKLFNFSGIQTFYKLTPDIDKVGEGDKKLAKWDRLLKLIYEYQYTEIMYDAKDACEILINSIKDNKVRADLKQPYNRDDMEIIKRLVQYRNEDENLSFATALSRIKRELGIKDRTISEF